MGDNLDRVFQKFFNERTENLFDRFDGLYRGIVEETNDPLRIGRIRVRIPELHNKDVKRDELPWAAPAFPFGGKGCGWWGSPMIGDVIFVQFEKNHPYAPLWVGAATPTRRKFYPLQSIHGQTPLAVNDQGQPADSPSDFQKEYLPKDERPMTVGVRDRYGTFFMLSSVGFFPKEHEEQAANAGTDAVAKSAYKAARAAPTENDPDIKHAVIHTKYGHTFILSDTGYDWKKEFKGDHQADESFEISRYKYLQKFFNEDKPKDRDQRRIELRTRYGHKFEMRDVGWKKNRPGEFEKQAELAKGSEDERWVKLRTKGGHVIQSIDKGNDPISDKFVKQLLKTDKGSDLDGENEVEFKNDARQIRLVTRHGHKIAIDDRGSDKQDALGKGEPRGNGLLIKTRRGFTVDANDKDPANRLLICSPNSQVIDINDRFGYTMISTDTAKKIPEEFKGLKNNEFSKTVALTMDPEKTSFCLKLDKTNRYVSLKTPEGQGLEMRDGGAPCASFTETTGPDDRGMWMSRDHNRAVWRSKNNDMYIVLDDGKQLILIKNETDKIQIFAKGNVEVISDADICLKAKKNISLKAGGQINMEAAGGTQFTVRAGHCGTNDELRAGRVNCISMYGLHEVIDIPQHPLGPAPTGAATGCTPCDPQEEKVDIRKPKPFNIERNCAPNKLQATPVPPSTFSGGGGGFNMPPPSPSTPPPPSPFAPSDTPNVTVLPEPTLSDPLSPSGGALFYGTSNVFKVEITEFGIRLNSFANNENEPPATDAKKITLFFNTLLAADAAEEAKKIHGGLAIIYRITGVPQENIESLLTYFPDKLIAEYRGDIPTEGIEFFEEEPATT
jgi:hypothetical protein